MPIPVAHVLAGLCAAIRAYQNGRAAPGPWRVRSAAVRAVAQSGGHLRVQGADKGDGAYTVTYNPQTTGEYLVDGALAGEKLPGSSRTFRNRPLKNTASN